MSTHITHLDQFTRRWGRTTIRGGVFRVGESEEVYAWKSEPADGRYVWQAGNLTGDFPDGGIAILASTRGSSPRPSNVWLEQAVTL